jgi:hypothetical protein
LSKSIDTLAADIKGMLGASDSDMPLHEDVLAKFGAAAASNVARSLKLRKGERTPKTLYMSEIGKPCHRQIWMGVHYPNLAEPLQEHTKFKFLYGDMIEEVALLLAEASGHNVTYRQEGVAYTINGWEFRGRIDAIIDGVLVDVKSCSPYGFKKFEEGLTDSNDSFGYRAQLAGYNRYWVAGRMGFLAVDKQNGHVGFFEQDNTVDLDALAEELTFKLESLTPPKRTFSLVPEGKSGNMKLGVECSYCPYKQACWHDANGGKGLKAYAYSTGPVFLGTVTKEPKVMEMPLKWSPAGSSYLSFTLADSYGWTSGQIAHAWTDHGHLITWSSTPTGNVLVGDTPTVEIGDATSPGNR